MFCEIKELIPLCYTKEKVFFPWSCVFMNRRGGRRLREWEKDKERARGYQRSEKWMWTSMRNRIITWGNMRCIEGIKEEETERRSKKDWLLTRGVGWELDTFINHEANSQVFPWETCLMTALISWVILRGKHHKELPRQWAAIISPELGMAMVPITEQLWTESIFWLKTQQLRFPCSAHLPLLHCYTEISILKALLQKQTQFPWPHLFIFNLNLFLGNMPFALNCPL